MAPNDRRCVSCRRVAPKAEFWRVVRLANSTTIGLDQGMGRSAYLCPTANCLRLAQRKNRLGRSLRVPIPDSLWILLWQRLDPRTNPTQAPEPGISEPAKVGEEPALGIPKTPQFTTGHSHGSGPLTTLGAGGSPTP